MGRGRPRTRRIIARVILPRLCRGSPFPSLSFRLAFCRTFCTHACTRTYARVSICMREKLGRKKKNPAARAARGEQRRAWRRGRGVEALEEEVRGQPHSRRSRRDAHRATPTRKSFSTKPSSSSPSSFSSSSSSYSPSASSFFILSCPFHSLLHETRRVSESVFRPDCTLHAPIPNSWHINENISACRCFRIE